MSHLNYPDLHISNLTLASIERSYGTSANFKLLMFTAKNLWQLIGTYGNLRRLADTCGNLCELMGTYENLGKLTEPMEIARTHWESMPNLHYCDILSLNHVITVARQPFAISSRSSRHPSRTPQHYAAHVRCHPRPHCCGQVFGNCLHNKFTQCCSDLVACFSYQRPRRLLFVLGLSSDCVAEFH